MNFHLTKAFLIDVEWIANLESDTYSGIDVIPFATLRGWFQANPEIFYIIRDHEGRPVGHIDILPLREKVLQPFIQGTMIERDILPEGLYTAEEKDQVTDLYIESVAIPYLKGYARAVALRDALAGIRLIIGNLCNPNPQTTLYAMPASTEGLQLMEHIGFRLLVNGQTRKDGHSLYVLPLTDFLVGS